MSDDKTEEPTAKKIEDARKKGQIAMSRDLAKVGPLLAMAEIAFLTEPLWRDAVHSLMELGIMRIGKPFLPALMETLSSAGLCLLIAFLVCFVVCIPVGIIFHWGQFGILIAPEAATVKFDKLNPVNGIKGLFSKKKLFEVMISVAKASLIGWFVYGQVRAELPSIVHLAAGSPGDAYFGFIAMLRGIFHALVGMCIVAGIVDLGIQKAFHKKDLMMDKEEIKREYKESEGDPMVKGQRKQLAREWANEEPAARTQKANAVVVNPTHFAVAMFYDAAEAMVPVVLAKGKDEIAQAMIRRAREHNIPVIRHVWLARTLYATAQADSVIPKSSYEAVAQVYAVVNELVAMRDTGREVELESLGEPPESYRRKGPP
jgi:type III secretion protein U